MECKVLHNKLNDTNLFKGPPCPEQEEAWRGIIKSAYSCCCLLWTSNLMLHTKIPTFE